MSSFDLKARTKKFAVTVVNLVKTFPEKKVYWIIGDQVLRAATSVGANYRAACRSKSKNDFSYKINIVLEEADETCFWLELLEEAELVDPKIIKPIWKEANELTAIFSKALITAKSSK